jgi:hypothetical protein
VPRRLTLPTRELGELKLQVIYQNDGAWEAAWAPLQRDPLASLFTVVSKETWTHALKGWTLPLVQALGIPPEGALRKLPKGGGACFKRGRCPHYNRDECVPSHKKMPWCFEPGSIESEAARRLGAEAVGLWREGVYILVVEET